MRTRHIFLFLFALSAIVLVGCKSKEEKAADLIKKELSKTLYDFDSYQPIETTVTEAYVNAYNDSVCWNTAGALAYGIAKIEKCLNDCHDAQDHMEIWRPSYYSSSYSDNKYYKYKKEFEDAVAELNSNIVICNMIGDSLMRVLEKLDKSQKVGWEVQHSFRCKNRGGQPDIAHYRYVISKNYKTIILQEDLNSETDKLTRDLLKDILEKGWEKLHTLE